MAGIDLELELSPRQLCDTELICNGGFSPLTGFMTEEEYNSVVENNRLPNGLLFGLPVVYDTDREDLKPGAYRMHVESPSQSPPPPPTVPWAGPAMRHARMNERR